MNLKAVESLVRAGALDSLHGADSRAAMLAAAPDAFRAGKSLASDRSTGQNMLFGGGGEDAGGEPAGVVRMPLPEIKPWDRVTRLAEEKESLGFFISGHPLDDNASSISEFCTTDTGRITDLQDGARVVLAGVVNRVRPVVTKTGNKMAMTTLTDKFGTIEAVVFSEAFAKFGAELQVDRIVAVVGSFETSRGEPQIVIDEVAGYLICVASVDRGDWLLLAIGFLVFRVLDIAKPPPIRLIDRKLGGGTGVVLDDVAAGALGAGVMAILAQFV